MAEQGFTLTSPDFVPDGIIATRQTCDGQNISPQLEWIHAPEGVQSFTLIVEDPDAPNGTFTHWVLFDIPADRKQLSAQVSDVGTAGRNDFKVPGYGGPCPPPNHGQHRYYFRLFALNTPSLELEAGAPRKAVEEAMEGHILDRTELMGRFERKTG